MVEYWRAYPPVHLMLKDFFQIKNDAPPADALADAEPRTALPKPTGGDAAMDPDEFAQWVQATGGRIDGAGFAPG